MTRRSATILPIELAVGLKRIVVMGTFPDHDVCVESSHVGKLGGQLGAVAIGLQFPVDRGGQCLRSHDDHRDC